MSHNITVFSEIGWIIRGVNLAVIASDDIDVIFLLINIIYHV